METNPEAPAVPQFKDRSTGLLVFGIIEVLLGCVCGLLLLFIFFALSKMQTVTGSSTRGIFPSVILYGGLAVALIWLGIGSIQAKRWARALSLVLAWSWFAIGIIATIFTAVVFQQVMQGLDGTSGTATSVAWIGMLIGLGILFVLLVLIPLVLVIFVQNLNGPKP